MSQKESIYRLAIRGLAEKSYEYTYVLETDFFTDYAPPQTLFPWTRAAITVRLYLDKQERLYWLRFVMEGQIETLCDRCAEEIVLPVAQTHRLLVKVLYKDVSASNDTEKDPSVYYIHAMEAFLDIRPWLYDFSLLSIPLRRQCRDAQPVKACNEAALQWIQEA